MDRVTRTLRLHHVWSGYGCSDGWRDTFAIPKRARRVRFHIEEWRPSLHDVRSCIRFRWVRYDVALAPLLRWEKLNGAFRPPSASIQDLIPTDFDETYALWVDYEMPKRGERA